MTNYRIKVLSNVVCVTMMNEVDGTFEEYDQTILSVFGQQTNI
jgi:hypothetical protein